jgi:hypothetical protein
MQRGLHMATEDDAFKIALSHVFVKTVVERFRATRSQHTGRAGDNCLSGFAVERSRP